MKIVEKNFTNGIQRPEVFPSPMRPRIPEKKIVGN